jgi:membrane protease YdiL (CAAX protease family)
MTMRLPGWPSLVVLVYVLLILPWAALRSARAVRAIQNGTSPRPLSSRMMIWSSTLVSLVLLFLLVWLTGRGFGFHIFATPPLRTRDIAAAGIALAAHFGLRSILRALTPESERRKKFSYRVAPRTPPEWALWTATVIAASITEEVAYRGVVMSILWYSLGNPWIAALISATAFSLAHWIQGVKSAIVVFFMALVMHGLVAFTHTLVLAMMVHAIYDFVAGYRIARNAKAWSASDSASSSAGIEIPAVPVPSQD